MKFLKLFLPKFLIKFLRPYYHGLVAIFAHVYFGRPSRKLVVIGVTGTAGKSTTVQLISRILNFSGKNTGFITTVSYYDGSTEHVNKHGLSMPGGWLLQKQLRQMVQNNCKYAVVECTSEGLAQNRHRGINFSMAVFTNLTPAHIDTHGSFENYRSAKGKLFKALNLKRLGVGILNADDSSSQYFANFKTNKTFKYGIKNSEADLVAANIEVSEAGLKFKINNINFQLPLIGEFNIYNALGAVASAIALGVSMENCPKALVGIGEVKGRMQEVQNSKGFKVFVDYAPEPAAMKASLEAVSKLPHARIIHVFGSTGGHRDVSKRFEFGKISASIADHVIVTNDDVYESDPGKIALDIETGIRDYEPRKPSYEIILDRKKAIVHALSIAHANDIVLFTGKGSEQFLVLPGNKKIDWDEVETIRNILNNFNPKS